IGDMGNNDGNRTDLKIYKVRKADFDFSQNGIIAVQEVIQFHYPEQTSFESNSKHNFDCEAIIYFEGKIYLFTKHRLDGETVLYRIPSTEGNYAAERLASFNPGMRVTAADISFNQNSVLLLGYNKNADCI